MISALTLAIISYVGLPTLSGVIHPNLAPFEAFKPIDAALRRSPLASIVQRFFEHWRR